MTNRVHHILVCHGVVSYQVREESARYKPLSKGDTTPRHTHLLGAIRPYVPSGHAILRSVFTMAHPPLDTTVFSAEDKSNPADWGELLTGILACFDSNFTCSISFGLRLDDDGMVRK